MYQIFRLYFENTIGCNFMIILKFKKKKYFQSKLLAHNAGTSFSVKMVIFCAYPAYNYSSPVVSVIYRRPLCDLHSYGDGVILVKDRCKVRVATSLYIVKSTLYFWQNGKLLVSTLYFRHYSLFLGKLSIYSLFLVCKF